MQSSLGERRWPLVGSWSQFCSRNRNVCVCQRLTRLDERIWNCLTAVVTLELPSLLNLQSDLAVAAAATSCYNTMDDAFSPRAADDQPWTSLHPRAKSVTTMASITKPFTLLTGGSPNGAALSQGHRALCPPPQAPRVVPCTLAHCDAALRVRIYFYPETSSMRVFRADFCTSARRMEGVNHPGR